MDLNRFVKTVVSTLGTEFGIHLLMLGTTMLVVRNLTPDDYGVLSLFLTLAQTLGYLANLGLPQAVIFFIGKQRAALDRVATNTLFLFIIIGCLTIGLIYGLRPVFASSFLKALPLNIYPWLLVMILANLVDNFSFSVNRALQQFFLFNIRRLLTPAFYLIAILISYGMQQIHLVRVIGIYVTIQCAVTLLFLIQTLRQTKLEWKLDWRLNRAMTSYGIKSYLQILAGHLVYQIDIYLIAALTNTSQVAYYTLAVSLANLIWYLPNTVGLVLFPTLSAVQNEMEIHRFSARVCRHTL
ncbi:oligosaccharide flippase family protein, partial [candidate division KSB1 bacterium]|nr:oligosaccharide flippase family protein [candidate division KSB1 bacterium]